MGKTNENKGSIYYSNQIFKFKTKIYDEWFIRYVYPSLEKSFKSFEEKINQ